ncbi:hypothetical protein C8Q75DRAFT_717009 [Abortiporus biennis]|nr:hypothetical protein C8Q75DRAFT_717009 [Abortiporus biennis]
MYSSEFALIITSITVLLSTSWIFDRRGTGEYRSILNNLLILHSIYILYTWIVLYPPNVFRRLHLPLTVPSETIRQTLILKAGLDGNVNATLPQPLEDLFTKLSSFDTRTYFIRFGQQAVQDCEYCKTYDEYAFFVLPGILLQYIREAAMIGFITIQGSYRERWRMYAVAILVCVAFFEGYFIATAQIKIPPNGLNVAMLHDTIWTLRQIVFLLLPIIVHFLPAAIPPPDPIATLTSTQMVLQLTNARLTTLKFLHGAIMRDSSLRGSAVQWWSGQKKVGDAVREDENVQRIAEQGDYGFIKTKDGEEGKFSAAVKNTVQALIGGIGIQ